MRVFSRLPPSDSLVVHYGWISVKMSRLLGQKLSSDWLPSSFVTPVLMTKLDLLELFDRFFLNTFQSFLRISLSSSHVLCRTRNVINNICPQGTRKKKDFILVFCLRSVYSLVKLKPLNLFFS